MRERRFDGWLVAVLLIGAIAIGLMVYFDLSTDEPIMDEYARQWALRRLVSGQSLQLWGTNAAIVQILEAWPAAALHLAPRFWRLPQLLFFALLPLYTFRLSRRFGADAFWSAVAAAAITCSPLTLGVATGMMNDTVFLGPFMAGAYYMLDWHRGARVRALFIAILFVATLQRNQGIGLVVVLGAWELWRWRRARPGLTELAWLAAAGGAALLALYVPHFFRSAVRYGGAPTHGGPGLTVFATSEFAIMSGFLLLPLAWGLLTKVEGEAATRTRQLLVPFALACAGLVGAATLRLTSQGTIFPGVWVGPWGLGPAELTEIKPAFWPAPLFLALEAATCFSLFVLLARRRAAWLPARLGEERTAMVVLAVVELLPVFAYVAAYDRFYMQIVAPVAPVAASLIAGASLRSIPARAWAVGALAVLVAYFAVGEQDYLAWHVARAAAARMAYQQFRPWQVAAGFEMDAQNVWIPATDDPTGKLPGVSEPCPKAFLAWTDVKDPRPGVSYISMVPGRIVVVRSSCP